MSTIATTLYVSGIILACIVALHFFLKYRESERLAKTLEETEDLHKTRANLYLESANRNGRVQRESKELIIQIWGSPMLDRNLGDVGRFITELQTENGKLLNKFRTFAKTIESYSDQINKLTDENSRLDSILSAIGSPEPKQPVDVTA